MKYIFLALLLFPVSAFAQEGAPTIPANVQTSKVCALREAAFITVTFTRVDADINVAMKKDDKVAEIEGLMRELGLTQKIQQITQGITKQNDTANFEVGTTIYVAELPNDAKASALMANLVKRGYNTAVMSVDAKRDCSAAS